MNYRSILMDFLVRKQQKACGICGNIFTSIGPPTFDHIIPKSLRGEDQLENLQAVHQVCNMKKGSKLIEQAEIEISTVKFQTSIEGLDDQISFYRREKIKEALKISNGNMSIASAFLKITYRKLRFYARKYGFTEPRKNNPSIRQS